MNQTAELPLVTVVTVVYNDASHLADTIASVARQTYERTNYVLVDGGSTDGSLEIIRANEAAIDQWVSEPDRGIYDAMNKGVALAKGEWVYFLNSGDVFVDEQVLAQVFAPAHEPADADVLYGSSIRVLPKGAILQRPKPMRLIWKSILTSHQAIFVRTALIREHPFDLQYRIGADYDLIYKLFTRGARFREVPVTIARVEARDGFSIVREALRQRENRLISAKYRWHPYFQLHLLALEWRAHWRAFRNRYFRG